MPDTTKKSLVEIIADIATPLIAEVINGAFTDEEVEAAGFKLGKLLTDAATAAAPGATWNVVETLIQKKLTPFGEGFNRGLDSDDPAEG